VVERGVVVVVEVRGLAGHLADAIRVAVGELHRAV